MLPAAVRLRDPESFRVAVRRGAKAGAPTLVVHLATGAPTGAPLGRARVGLIVGKDVGTAVVRNRVKRRLRHLVAPHLGSLPVDSVLVLRALPAAAGAPSAELRDDVARCVTQCLVRVAA